MSECGSCIIDINCGGRRGLSITCSVETIRCTIRHKIDTPTTRITWQ